MTPNISRFVAPATMFVAALLFVAPHARALDDNAPSNGIVYSEKESRAMRYECMNISSTGISCKFIQTYVLPNEKERDFKKWRGKADNQMPDALGKEQCDRFRQSLDIIEGRAKPPFPEKLASMPATERDEMLKGLKLMVAFCGKPTEQNKTAILRYNHGRALRTCLVGSRIHVQFFERLIDSGNPKTVTWVPIRTSPEGTCGIVDLSRFEKEKSESRMGYWNFYSRKAITNPKGKGLLNPDAFCSELDQDEYPYKWISTEPRVDCDYVKFEVF